MPERPARPGSPASADVALEIESLDLEARGIARNDGKVVFVEGALPGERVRARVLRRKPRFDSAQAVEVLRASSARITPRCPHFGVCGGCSMQHIDARAQVAFKQRVLEDQLERIGRVRAETMLRPMAGPEWGYRRRARFSVRDVPKKGGVLVGFHERGSSYVADIRECHVVPARMSALLLPLRELVGSLSIRTRVPQIEYAQGDETIALVFRVLEPPSAADRAALAAFATRERVEVWLQPKGPDSIALLATAARGDDSSGDAGSGTVSTLAYALPGFGLRMPFRPTDFTQVNHEVNEVLVQRAVALLAPAAHERVADLFCGLGNFSLPIATRAREVVGIEGSATLTARAAANAEANGLAARARFLTANLFETDAPRWQALGGFDAVLVDPPREGAVEAARAIAESPQRPSRIVYVSCNPATLARDAGILVQMGGYRLAAAGAVNMFAQTSHVESIAVFRR